MIETDRLVLRAWREDDLAPFAAICADPLVMRYFPRPATPDEVAASIARWQVALAAEGPALLATELKATGELIGFIGLIRQTFEASFTPCVEVGWRLAAHVWGQGLAPEGARACLAWGFDDLDQTEIVSLTAVQNLPSRRVMEKIGMLHDPGEDFDHPYVPEGHPVRRHVLYRLSRDEWTGRGSR